MEMLADDSKSRENDTKQRGVMLRRFVFPDVPVAHLVAQTRQSADDADKSGQSLFEAVIDARIFGREI